MALCLASDILGRSLAHQAARLSATGGPDVARALSFVGDLPPLESSGAGGALTRSAIEAYASLYYYGELELTSLIALAELVVEQRFELMAQINDRALLEALDVMEDQMRRGWYDQARRETIFRNMLGFGESNDIRASLMSVTEALARFDQSLRFGSTSQADGIAVEFAMASFLAMAGNRVGLGLERASQVLNGQLREALAILGNAALHRAFRVNDIWQLVREVAVTPDGSQPDVTAIVERAQSGAAIIGWMAGRLPQITARNGSLLPILANDGTLFRQSARWQMAARDLSFGQESYAPGTGYAQPGYGNTGYGQSPSNTRPDTSWRGWA
ncbi:MAG: hypothetical protein QNI90_13375 [Dinoroseobacter sp.]|nr:hypothetical protein [Dinoroseobacter sp.]